jgi:hypothetical protein
LLPDPLVGKFNKELEPEVLAQVLKYYQPHLKKRKQSQDQVKNSESLGDVDPNYHIHNQVETDYKPFINGS